MNILRFLDQCTVNLRKKSYQRLPALSPPSSGITKLIQETKTKRVHGMYVWRIKGDRILVILNLTPSTEKFPASNILKSFSGPGMNSIWKSIPVLSWVAAVIFIVRLLSGFAISKLFSWLAQTSVISLKTQMHAENALLKLLSQLRFKHIMDVYVYVDYCYLESISLTYYWFNEEQSSKQFYQVICGPLIFGKRKFRFENHLIGSVSWTSHRKFTKLPSISSTFYACVFFTKFCLKAL